MPPGRIMEKGPYQPTGRNRREELNGQGPGHGRPYDEEDLQDTSGEHSSESLVSKKPVARSTTGAALTYHSGDQPMGRQKERYIS
jgi:hypothetical protein